MKSGADIGSLGQRVRLFAFGGLSLPPTHSLRLSLLKSRDDKTLIRQKIENEGFAGFRSGRDCSQIGCLKDRFADFCYQICFLLMLQSVVAYLVSFEPKKKRCK